jgi:hypothetical protein
MYSSHYGDVSLDSFFVFFMIAPFGFMFLLSATDGRATHVIGSFTKLPVRRRAVAFVAAQVILVLAFAVCWTCMDASPLQMLHNAPIVWSTYNKWFAKLTVIIVYWALFSPFQSLLAACLITRAFKRERQTGHHRLDSSTSPA